MVLGAVCAAFPLLAAASDVPVSLSYAPLAGSTDMIATPSPFSSPAPSDYVTGVARLLAEDCLRTPSFSAREGRLSRSWNSPDSPATSPNSARRWSLLAKSAASRARIAHSPAPTRAEKLIPKLKEIFVSEGIPPELAWVAEVESRFDPAAESSAGARGLFQFMPETARRFGIFTEGEDRRAEPESCARAAARYLGILYGKFGSWALALAAYNSGEGRVQRLLNKHKANTFDEIAEFLPNETQLYVPKVMATLATRENVRLGALPAPASTPIVN